MDLVVFSELPGIHSLTWSVYVQVYVGLVGIFELPGIHWIVSTVNLVNGHLMDLYLGLGIGVAQNP